MTRLGKWKFTWTSLSKILSPSISCQYKTQQRLFVKTLCTQYIEHSYSLYLNSVQFQFFTYSLCQHITKYKDTNTKATNKFCLLVFLFFLLQHNLCSSYLLYNLHRGHHYSGHNLQDFLLQILKFNRLFYYCEFEIVKLSDFFSTSSNIPLAQNFSPSQAISVQPGPPS